MSVRSPAARTVDLVVMVNGFPRVSETFVLQELLYLERCGLRMHLVALNRTDEAVRQSALASLRASVEYLPLMNPPVSAAAPIPANPRRMARLAHMRLLAYRRAAYLGGVVGVVRSPDFSRVRLDRATILASRLLSLGSPPLYIHFAHKPATIGRFASLLAGVPYALSCHAKDIWLTPPDELGAKLRDAQTALVCTATGRRELERHAAGATPVRLVYHGVDLSAASASRVADGGHRILTVGRLVEKKGHDTLIRAAALLRDRGVPFTLRIVGDGVDWARLQRLVHQLDLGERVVFLGPLSAEEVQEEYATCAVFALASRVLPSGDRDGLPNVVLEAMVCGLPVVATTLTGVAEAVEQEQSGLLVAPDDPAALAGALARVLGDGALAERLGRGARERVHQKFDCNRTLPGVAEALAAAGLIGVGAVPGSRVADERETLAAA